METNTNPQDAYPALNMIELTKAQRVTLSFGTNNTLPSVLPSGITYDTYRQLRKDPTVALARGFICASVLSGSWSIEADEDVDDDIVEFIASQVKPLRSQIMECAILYGHIDYGWQGFEIIYSFDRDSGLITIKKIKPLLHDITRIVIDRNTGEFMGYVQQEQDTGADIIIPANKCLHIRYRQEAGNLFGEGLLENIRVIIDNYNTADAGAIAYDKKVAGSHFVVYYPPGQSIVNGIETDNGEVAQQILTALEASGSVTVPTTLTNLLDSLNTQVTADMYSWKITLIEDSGGRQPTFIERLKYLDAIKVRGLVVPERSILEGTFGTKAEAGEHADMALKNIQLIDTLAAEQINQQLVNTLLEMNFGKLYKDKVRISPAPLIDEQIAYLRDLYKVLLSNPTTLLAEFDQIDLDAIKDKLKIPKMAVISNQQGQETSDTELENEAALTADEIAQMRASGLIPQTVANNANTET